MIECQITEMIGLTDKYALTTLFYYWTPYQAKSIPCDDKQ